MKTLNPLRMTFAALLAGSLLVPAAAAAAPGPSGTLVGTVTCGPGEETLAANIRVSVEGIDLSTHTDGAGMFRLSGVPAAQTLTVDAVGSPDAFSMASRSNVAIEPGQVLDIGNLDLAVCPRPAPAGDEMTMEQRQDNHD